MKTKVGATVLAAAFLAALVIPWTVLAGGGGGGRGGGAGQMGGASFRNQTQMQNNFQTRGMDAFRAQDRNRDQDRDRVRQQIHKLSGTEPAAATPGSAVSATGDKAKKGSTYGPGDGTGHVALGEEPPKDGDGYGAPSNR
ncbi:MAG: hypothetical protein H6Q82_2939 [Deltaproteobacteria bacterium]|nr:hypothetical protein [Deltaproteobacteria bacterium]